MSVMCTFCHFNLMSTTHKNEQKEVSKFIEISLVGYQFSWKIPLLGQKNLAGAQSQHLLGICPPGQN